MEALVLVLRLVLAGVFAVAGVAKLKDRDGSRQALEDFGVPARLASPGGVLLPLAELAIAAALVVPVSAAWGAGAAGALLAVFMAAIANALAHGRAPDCHCFGQVRSEPAGWSTIARNGVLLGAAATVAAFGPGPAVHDWVADRSAAELAAVAAALAAAAVAARRARGWQRRREARREFQSYLVQVEENKRPRGKPVGSAAPSFALRGVRSGDQVTLESLRAPGTPIALVFVNPGCTSCHDLLLELGGWQTTLAQSLAIAVVSSGNADENRSLYDVYGLADVLLQRGVEAAEAYEVPWTPSAVLVHPDGTIASPVVGGQLAIEGLVRLGLNRSRSWQQSSLVA